jgi:hypothetical protein
VSEPAEFLRRLTTALDESGIPHMLTGSFLKFADQHEHHECPEGDDDERDVVKMVPLTRLVHETNR